MRLAPPVTRYHRLPIIGGAVCCLAIGASVLGSTNPAAADSVEIAAVEQRVRALEAESANASERAVAARQSLAESQAALDKVTADLQAARAALDTEKRALAQLARQMYVNGGMDNATAGFALQDPDTFLRDLERVAAAGDQQSTVVSKADQAAAVVAKFEAAVTEQRDEQAQITQELEAARDASRLALEQAEVELARLQEEERRRIAEAIAAAREAARIAAEQEAARVRAEEEARAAAEAARRQAEAEAAAAEQYRQVAVAAAVVAQWQAQAAAADQAAAQAAAASQAAAAQAAAQAQAQQQIANQAAAAAQQQAQSSPAPSPVQAAPATGGGAPSDVSSWADSPYSQAIKMCESSGNYSINTGNGYYGAWQFDYPSWHWNGGGQFAEFPHQATKAQQDYVAWTYYQRSGWRPWECALKIG